MDFDPIKFTPVLENFDTTFRPNSFIEDDANIIETRKNQFKLLTIHECLGHISFAVLKLMARWGLIPKELAHITPPCCPGYAYVKAHIKPTRYKGAKQFKIIKPVNATGLCVRVYQLVSSTPGFVPTHRGIPTLQRYKGATVFVDHHSDYMYVHLMIGMNAASTVATKEAFEPIAHSHNCWI